VKRSPEGASAVRSAIRELEQHGYLTRERTKDEHGRYNGIEVLIHEQPVSPEQRTYRPPRTGEPHNENPHVDNPDVDNQTLLSIDDSLSNDCTKKPAPDGDDFSDLFNKPKGKPITTNLPATDDPLVLANHTAERRKQEKVYTVPADAGGADDWDVTVQAWGKLISKETSEMGQGTRIKLAQIFQQVGAATGRTAPEVARAIGRFKDEYEWWNDTWPGDGFCNRLGMLLVPDTADPERNLATSGFRRVEPVSGW